MYTCYRAERDPGMGQDNLVFYTPDGIGSLSGLSSEKRIRIDDEKS